MEFIQRCLRGRDHCRRIERERRARFGAVSRKSIRAITSSPKSPARLLSPPRDESATDADVLRLRRAHPVKSETANGRGGGARARARYPGNHRAFLPLSARGVGDAESPGSRGDSSPKSPVAPRRPRPCASSPPPGRNPATATATATATARTPWNSRDRRWGRVRARRRDEARAISPIRASSEASAARTGRSSDRFTDHRIIK